MAAAIGQAIDIPVIIRSLARDFYRGAIQHNYSIPFHRDFLLALDGGLGTFAGRPIDNFEYAWWKSKNPISDDKYLSMKTIEICLEYHRRQRENYKADNGPSRRDTGFQRPVFIWKTDASSPITDGDTCNRCRLYRAVALGTQDEHRDIRNLVQGMECSFAAHKQQSLRRASGFNQLYEYLSVKEQDPAAATEFTQNFTPTSYPLPTLSHNNIRLPLIPSRSNERKRLADRRVTAETVRQEAITEVQRISNMAPLKWTWGADMDLNEIKNLRRSADNCHRLPHSGYDTSLPQGVGTRSESPLLTVNDIDEDANFSDIGEDILPVPEMDIERFPPLDIRSPFKPIRYLLTLHEHDDQDMDAVAVADIPFPTQSIQPPPIPCVTLPTIQSIPVSTNGPHSEVDIEIPTSTAAAAVIAADDSSNSNYPTQAMQSMTLFTDGLHSDDDDIDIPTSTVAAAYLAEDESSNSDDPTPAMVAAVYLQDLSSSSDNDIPISLATGAYLADVSPSSSSDESITASIAAAAYTLPNNSPPDSDAESSVGSIDAAAAAAVFSQLPEHPDSDAESSVDSIDASTAAAIFPPLPDNMRGSSMDIDTSVFTLEPAGGVYTASYFSFVQDDWIE